MQKSNRPHTMYEVNQPKIKAKITNQINEGQKFPNITFNEDNFVHVLLLINYSNNLRFY